MPRWLRIQLDCTLSTWELHPELRRPEDFGWAGISTGYWIVDNIRDEEQTITLPEFTWHPRRDRRSRESIERFVLDVVKIALRKRLDEIEELASQRGLLRTPEARQQSHFNWAVRYQCLGERVTDIASSIDAARGDVRTINSGIMKVLSLVGISRRSEKPGPVSKS
jgi:hypothetical protein